MYMKDIVKLIVGILIAVVLAFFALDMIGRCMFINDVKQNTTNTAQNVSIVTIQSVAPNNSTDTHNKVATTANKDERNTTNSLAVVLIVMMFMGAISSANRW